MSDENFKLSQNERTFDHSVRGKADGSQEEYRGLRNKHEQWEDNEEEYKNDPEQGGVIGEKLLEITECLRDPCVIYRNRGANPSNPILVLGEPG